MRKKGEEDQVYSQGAEVSAVVAKGSVSRDPSVHLQKGMVLMKTTLQAMCEQNGMAIYYNRSSTETRLAPGVWGRSVHLSLLGRADS